MLRGDRRWGGLGGRGVGRAVDEGQAGFGEDFQAHVPALLGPLVGLLGQDGADQADDRGPVREDPDHVGAAADLLVQPLLWVVRSALTPLANP
jgi:hypothetical protein